MDREIATFGGGCFWCTEALFKRIKGVQKVVSGYSGGHVPNPSYEEVSEGVTGHAEAVQIDFDPQKISYRQLLEIFWTTHDPTTIDRQGNDIGPQYRSVIFYHNAEQKKIAETLKDEIEGKKIFKKPVVTQIVPFENFYKAEDYHQDYFEKNPGKPYCQIVINPKINKLRKNFKDKLKND